MTAHAPLSAAAHAGSAEVPQPSSTTTLPAHVCCASALSLQSSELASSVKDCALVGSSTVEREPSDSTGCNVGCGLDGGLSDDGDPGGDGGGDGGEAAEAEANRSTPLAAGPSSWRAQQKTWTVGVCCSRRPGVPGCATGCSKKEGTSAVVKSSCEPAE
eukprot:4462984-Prymnesium_polylepis.1